MQNQKFKYEPEISVNEVETDTQTFKKEFQENLNNEMELSDLFTDELKHVQKMAIIGKLNPSHKLTLIEWKQLYPERFEAFCETLEEVNRQKLLNFLE